MNWKFLLAAAAALFTLASAFDVYTNGPDVLATQFDLKGQPISWMSAKYFFYFYFLFVVIVNSVLFGSRLLIQKDKNMRWINLPNKEFWLRPENRVAGHQRALEMMDWVVLFVNLVVASSVVLVRSEPYGSIVNWYIAGVFAFTGIFIYKTIRIFKIS